MLSATGTISKAALVIHSFLEKIEGWEGKYNEIDNAYIKAKYSKLINIYTRKTNN